MARARARTARFWHERSNHGVNASPLVTCFILFILCSDICFLFWGEAIKEVIHQKKRGSPTIWESTLRAKLIQTAPILLLAYTFILSAHSIHDVAWHRVIFRVTWQQRWTGTIGAKVRLEEFFSNSENTKMPSYSWILAQSMQEMIKKKLQYDNPYLSKFIWIKVEAFTLGSVHTGNQVW